MHGVKLTNHPNEKIHPFQSRSSNWNPMPKRITQAPNYELSRADVIVSFCLFMYDLNDT